MSLGGFGSFPGASRSSDERPVFFIESLGFITPTAARRICYEDALRFEQVHIETYRRLGYDLVCIPPGDLEARADQVLENTPFQ